MTVMYKPNTCRRVKGSTNIVREVILVTIPVWGQASLQRRVRGSVLLEHGVCGTVFR